jgi:hypothetical protein
MSIEANLRAKANLRDLEQALALIGRVLRTYYEPFNGEIVREEAREREKIISRRKQQQPEK